MARLYLLDNNGSAARQWDVGDEPLSIGRDESADIQVDDGALSRRHFLISRDGGRYIVKDLGSENGTWVDGQRATSTLLHDHDCIVAGRTVFVFSEKPQMAASEPRAVAGPA